MLLLTPGISSRGLRYKLTTSSINVLSWNVNGNGMGKSYKIIETTRLLDNYDGSLMEIKFRSKDLLGHTLSDFDIFKHYPKNLICLVNC